MYDGPSCDGSQLGVPRSELLTPLAAGFAARTVLLEGFAAAKVLVEGLRKAGKEITRESLQRSLSALGRIDVGGHVVEFRPGFRHGGKFVDIGVIFANGELRS